MACPIPRRYPKKQPPDWKPPVPRWQLSFPPSLGVTSIHTIYVGIQSHPTPDSNPATTTTTTLLSSATTAVKSWLASTSPAATDAFLTEESAAHDIPGSRVWVAYYTSASAYNSALASLDLVGKYRQLSQSTSTSSTTPLPIGLWAESFTTPLERLETNYAGLHERPGLASIPGTERDGHELSAYWGAARDRIPASGGDLFEVPGSKVPEAAREMGDGGVRVNGEALREIKTGKDGKKTTAAWHVTDDLSTDSPLAEVQYPSAAEVPRGYGQRLVGGNYDNVTHIRSGQCWDQCPEDEAGAYTAPNGLQEKLMKGMGYLWGNARETGTLGLRWLRNVREEDGEDGTTNGVYGANGASARGQNGVNGHAPINGHTAAAAALPPTKNETCGAGFFRNLKDLEKWSSTHPSHMAIFAGAHKHAREWGPERKFMTWHEVSVLKKGEARWEYVNCDPCTGVVRFVRMEGVEELG